MRIAQPSKTRVEMTIRAKAFTGEGIRWHRVLVDGVSVRVYDSIAGYFTTCHRLSKRTIAAIIASAANGEGQ